MFQRLGNQGSSQLHWSGHWGPLPQVINVRQTQPPMQLSQQSHWVTTTRYRSEAGCCNMTKHRPPRLCIAEANTTDRPRAGISFCVSQALIPPCLQTRSRREFMRSLTVDPFSFRVMDHKLRSEQVLHGEFGVAPGLAVCCERKKGIVYNGVN